MKRCYTKPMTKRIFVFLLILIVAGPVMGWACNCCPSEAYDYSHHPVLKAGHHNCCTNMKVEFSSCQGLSAPKFVITNPPESLKILQRLPSGDLEKDLFKVLDFYESSKAVRRFSLDFSPPAAEPIYLTHRTLLI